MSAPHENESIAAERVLVEAFADQGGESIETFAHVGGSTGKENALTVGKAQHGCNPATRRPNQTGSIPVCSWSEIPQGSTMDTGEEMDAADIEARDR